MNIIQKLMYLRGLYKYYSANFLQKQLIDKQVGNLKISQKFKTVF